MEKYDGIIIGFGKGGKTLAGDLAASGKKIALIEKSAMMYGGTCINVACIPTKSLVNSAKIAQLTGADNPEAQAELYRRAIVEKRRLTTLLRQKNFDKLNTNDKVTVYTGTASFLAPKQIRIELERESITIEGEQIFINTGSRPMLPDIPGLNDSARVYNSETLMEVEELPRRLAIIGAGYVGLEFASIYASFGSRVTVYNDGQDFLPREDEEIAAEIHKLLTEQGIDIRMGTSLRSVVDRIEGTILSYDDLDAGLIREQPADAILIATGRLPNTEELNLDLGGIETGSKGEVKVDHFLRASQADTWALGDVYGGEQFTYTSLDDYRIVRSQLSGSEKSYSLNDRKNTPYTLFIDPAYSRVGLNEKEALEQGCEVKIARLPVAAIPKAQLLRETKGVLKAVIDKKTDRILGAMLLCVESYEVINIIKLAMDAGLPYTHLKDQVFTHPTMSEALNDLFSL